jgi:hypothetical protein
MFNLIHSLLTTELDMALVTSPPGEQKLTLVHMFTSVLCVLLPEEHPAAVLDQITLPDLAKRRLDHVQ